MNDIQALQQSISLTNSLLSRLVDLLGVSQPQFFTMEELEQRYKLPPKHLAAAIARVGATVIKTGRIRRISVGDMRRIDIYLRGQAAGLDSIATPSFPRRPVATKKSTPEGPTSSRPSIPKAGVHPKPRPDNGNNALGAESISAGIKESTKISASSTPEMPIGPGPAAGPNFSGSAK